MFPPCSRSAERAVRRRSALHPPPVRASLARPGPPMSTVRIALANLPFPASPEESVRAAGRAISQASAEGAGLICFPECFVPGYRGAGKRVPPPDPAFLERAWSEVARAAARADVAVVLGTERAA